jgi:hypothetical protein
MRDLGSSAGTIEGLNEKSDTGLLMRLTRSQARNMEEGERVGTYRTAGQWQIEGR